MGSYAADAELARFRSEGDRRRRAGQAAIVASWARGGGLAVDEARATDVLWALTSPELYLLLVTGRGWTPDEYEAWLSGTLEGLVFGPSAEE